MIHMIIVILNLNPIQTELGYFCQIKAWGGGVPSPPPCVFILKVETAINVLRLIFKLFKKQLDL